MSPGARVALGSPGLSPGLSPGGPHNSLSGTSRNSLYSDYSFYALPEDSTSGTSTPRTTMGGSRGPSPGPGFSYSRSPGGSPGMGSSAGDRSPNTPGSRSGLQMTPNIASSLRTAPSPSPSTQKSQGRNLTPVQPPQNVALPPSQLTRDGLYQPIYHTEMQDAAQKGSFFKRKKSRSSTSGSTSSASLPPPSPHRQGFGTGSIGSSRTSGAGNGPSPLSPSGSAAVMPFASSPEDYLQLGITYHEQDKLALSAHCFEQSATFNGGCGMGMVMWGMTLRSGWGVKVDQTEGFYWLKRAADGAVTEMEQAGQGADDEVIKVRTIVRDWGYGR